MFKTETLTFYARWFVLEAFIRLASSIVSLYLAVKRQKMLMYRWHIYTTAKTNIYNLAHRTERSLLWVSVDKARGHFIRSRQWEFYFFDLTMSRTYVGNVCIWEKQRFIWIKQCGDSFSKFNFILALDIWALLCATHRDRSDYLGMIIHNLYRLCSLKKIR